MERARSPPCASGKIEDKWVLNPTFQQLEFSSIDLTVSGSDDSILMVEGGALEISEAEVVEALKVAQVGIREQVKIQLELIAKDCKPKMEWTPAPRDEALVKKVRSLAEKPLAKAMNGKDKAGRAAALADHPSRHRRRSLPWTFRTRPRRFTAKSRKSSTR